MNGAMSFASVFAEHHHHCDDAFANAEACAQQADWAGAQQGFDAFSRAMTLHLATEEEALFPAFETATGMQGGPTQVMRLEHTQMRQLLEAMTQALEAKDADGFGGAAETLLVLMQQHNMKEEHMLYPMCDRALASNSALLDRVTAELAKA
jgi:hemerythrin-like domain-containing protein